MSMNPGRSKLDPDDHPPPDAWSFDVTGIGYPMSRHPNRGTGPASFVPSHLLLSFAPDRPVVPGDQTTAYYPQENGEKPVLEAGNRLVLDRLEHFAV
jgi:hypothetical protein